MLQRFGLDPHRKRRVAELPGGVRKLLDIAMAMTGAPKLLLLDEPSSGVSAEEKFPMMDIIMGALGQQAQGRELTVEALALGKRAAGANLWAQGRFGARVPLGDIGRDLSPFPFLLILGQDDNERLLGAALRRCDMAVQWNTELVALQQQASGVKATLSCWRG